MPSLVHEFYEAYGQALPKSKCRVQMVLKPLEAVEVRGMQVPCGKAKINDVLYYTFWSQSYLKYLMQLNTFEYIKSYLAPLIGILASSWLEEGSFIKNNEVNIPAHFWFGFVSSNLMPSQKDSIL